MGYSKAAAALMQSAAPAVQTGYTNAANADAGYSRGLGDQVQQQLDQNSQASNAFLKQVGSPDSALQQAAPVGDIAYGLQGYIPATSLQREGAAWGAAAQLAPANLLHEGQQESQSILQNDPNLPKLQNDLASIAATQPAVYQDILRNYQEQAYKQAELGQSQQRLAIEGYRAKVSAQQGQERINIEAQRAAQSALSSNRNYRLSLARLGISEKSAQLRWMTAQARFNNGGYTPNEIHGMQIQANQIAGDAMKHGADLRQVMHTMQVNDIPPSVAFSAAKMSGYKPGKPGMFSGFAKGLGGAGAGAGNAAESAAARTIVGLAHKYLGTPYVWGGESPKGFDCSGFAQYLYGKAGIHIPRTTYTQWQAGHSVPPNQLAPGDLVFFKGSDSKGGLPGHVGIYIGNGRFIEEAHTGTNARISTLAGYPGFMGARRYGKV